MIVFSCLDEDEPMPHSDFDSDTDSDELDRRGARTPPPPPPPPLPPKRCYVENIRTTEKHYVPNRKSFTLGRSKELGIFDRKVSRKQLQCYVDADHLCFLIKPIGRSISGINGKALTESVYYEVRDNEIIDLKMNLQRFRVRFETDPEYHSDGDDDPEKTFEQDAGFEDDKSPDEEEKEEEGEECRDVKKASYNQTPYECKEEVKEFSEENIHIHDDSDAEAGNMAIMESQPNLTTNGSTIRKSTISATSSDEEETDTSSEKVTQRMNSSLESLSGLEEDEYLTAESSPEYEVDSLESDLKAATKQPDRAKIRTKTQADDTANGNHPNREDIESIYDNLTVNSISSEESSFFENMSNPSSSPTRFERSYVNLFGPQNSFNADQDDAFDNDPEEEQPDVEEPATVQGFSELKTKKLRLN